MKLGPRPYPGATEDDLARLEGSTPKAVAERAYTDFLRYHHPSGVAQSDSS